MEAAFEEAVRHFRAKGDLQPTHCDVRCAINDILDSEEKSGYRVKHGYSQDRAFREVRRSLKNG